MSIQFNRLQFAVNRRVMVVAAMVALMVVAVAPSFAQTTTAPTLDFDVSPLFESMNTYLPMFMGVFAIAAAIAGSAALVRMILSAIVDAFSGRF